MQKTKLCYITLLLISVTVSSFTCCEKEVVAPATLNPFGGVSWDYTALHEITVDSTTNPYTITNFDTSFAPHSQYAYFFSYANSQYDTVLYNNYNKADSLIGGKAFPFNNIVVLNIPPATPDTFSYSTSTLPGSLYFTHIVNGVHFSQTFMQLYTPR